MVPENITDGEKLRKSGIKEGDLAHFRLDGWNGAMEEVEFESGLPSAPSDECGDLGVCVTILNVRHAIPWRDIKEFWPLVKRPAQGGKR